MYEVLISLYYSLLSIPWTIYFWCQKTLYDLIRLHECDAQNIHFVPQQSRTHHTIIIKYLSTNNLCHLEMPANHLAAVALHRAPYDSIFTAEGITLRARAAMLPPLLEGDIGPISAPGHQRISHSRSKGNAVHHTGQLGGVVNG